MGMDGGGVEQVGATQAINDLLLLPVDGYAQQNGISTMHFCNGWELGEAVSFDKIRAPGAFLVSATRTAAGQLSRVKLVSEVGGRFSLHKPQPPVGEWPPTVHTTL